MRNPKPLEEVGGCETLSPKTGEWLRSPQTLKAVRGCETLNPRRKE